jgi:hypothetical protein
MAFCLIVDKPDQTDEQATRLFAHLCDSGPIPPDGARLVMAGPADRGWRVVSVWDTQEACDRFFADRLEPAYADIGLALDAISRSTFELHTLVAGDVTGTLHPVGT